ncbi:MAG: ABC transporter ATP-binding protein [Candidatus Solibacter sp.]
MSFALVAVVGETITDLLQPWTLKIVLDNVVKSKPIHGHGWLDRVVLATAGTDPLAVLRFAAIASLAVALFGAVCSYAEKYLTTSAGQWMMHDLRRTLYSHVQRLSLSYHDNKQTGDLLSRVTSDIDSVQSFVASGVLGAVINLLTLFGMVSAMLYINWRFTLIALSVAPVLFVVIYSFTRRIKKAAREVRNKEGEIVSVIQEVLTSIRVVKAFAREDYEQKRLEEESLESVEIALRARSLKARLSPIVEVIVAVGTAMVLWFGARMVLAGQLSAGSLVVFILYLGKMYKPMQELSKTTDAFSKATVGYERIREILDTEREVADLPGARPAPPLKGSIELENVSFHYTPETPILRGVTLRVEPGQTIALVGPTGAGKTTVISLIPRFYDPVEGVVKIDGRDVREYTQASLRQQISLVLQETILFHGPIWNNIAYGKPGASREEIYHAAEIANAREFIEKLPHGYDTVVGERGVTLSGGQRQRIAIARAVIRNTPILILDEPSSGLDAGSEKLVFEALDRLMEGRTSIVIAHRLATIQRADKIYVLEQGAVRESGTHEELLQAGGLYSELHELQFRDEHELTGN